MSRFQDGLDAPYADYFHTDHDSPSRAPTEDHGHQKRLGDHDYIDVVLTY